MKLRLVGNGGHCLSVQELLEERKNCHLEILSIEQFDMGLLDNNVKDYDYFFAVGDLNIRRKMFQKSAELNLSIPTIMSRHATVSQSAQIGLGTVIMPSAVIRTLAKVGSQSIVNTSCIVDHEAHIGSFVNLSPGAVICGKVCIGDSVFVGAGAIIIDGVSICENVVVGAGATVISDITKPGTYVGCPARRI